MSGKILLHLAYKILPDNYKILPGNYKVLPDNHKILPGNQLSGKIVSVVITGCCDPNRNNKMDAFGPLILELGGRFKKGMSLYAGFYRKSIPNEKYVFKKYF